MQLIKNVKSKLAKQTPFWHSVGRKIWQKRTVLILILAVGLILSQLIPAGITAFRNKKTNQIFATLNTKLDSQDQVIQKKSLDAQSMNDEIIANAEVTSKIQNNQVDLLQKKLQEIRLEKSAGFIIITDLIGNTITETNENSTPQNLLEEYQDSVLPLFRGVKPIEAVAINKLSRPVIIAGKPVMVGDKKIAYVISGYYLNQEYVKEIAKTTEGNLGIADSRGLILSSAQNGSAEQTIYGLSELNFSLKEVLSQNNSAFIKKTLNYQGSKYYLSAKRTSLSGDLHPIWLVNLKKEPSNLYMFKTASAETTSEVKQTVSEGRLYLKPDKSSYEIKEKGLISVMADSGGASINAIGVIINYRSDLVEVEGINFSGSLCRIIIEKTINPELGTAEISCGIPSPGKSVSNEKVGALMIIAKQNGTANFSIDDASAKMLVNDGSGSNILKYTENVSVNLGTSPTPVNSVTSGLTATAIANSAKAADTTATTTTTTSTKSSTTKKKTKKTATVASFVPSKVPVIKMTGSDQWCKDQTSFIWLKEDGVEKFEYELNTSMLEMKNPTTTTDTWVCLTIPDPSKRHFFHLQAVTGSETGQMSIIPISANTTTTLNNIPLDKNIIDTNAKPMQNILEDVPENNFTSSTFNFFKAIGEGAFRLFGGR